MHHHRLVLATQRWNVAGSPTYQSRAACFVLLVKRGHVDVTSLHCCEVLTAKVLAAQQDRLFTPTAWGKPCGVRCSSILLSQSVSLCRSCSHLSMTAAVLVRFCFSILWKELVHRGFRDYLICAYLSFRQSPESPDSDS